MYINFDFMYLHSSSVESCILDVLRLYHGPGQQALFIEMCNDRSNIGDTFCSFFVVNGLSSSKSGFPVVAETTCARGTDFNCRTFQQQQQRAVTDTSFRHHVISAQHAGLLPPVVTDICILRQFDRHFLLCNALFSGVCPILFDNDTVTMEFVTSPSYDGRHNHLTGFSLTYYEANPSDAPPFNISQGE